jgi:hypothetical protein
MNRLQPAIVFGLLFGLTFPGFAQHRTDPRQMYERIWVIAPMVGSGKSSTDPVRPLYAPAQRPSANAQQLKQNPPGIIAFGYQLSDDGKFALCELVAKDRQAFAAILADKRPDIRVFERGKAKKEEIEAAFRQYKKDFNIDKMGVLVR